MCCYIVEVLMLLPDNFIFSRGQNTSGFTLVTLGRDEVLLFRPNLKQIQRWHTILNSLLAVPLGAQFLIKLRASTVFHGQRLRRIGVENF